MLEEGRGESTGKVRCLKSRLALMAVIQIPQCALNWIVFVCRFNFLLSVPTLVFKQEDKKQF